MENPTQNPNPDQTKAKAKAKTQTLDRPASKTAPPESAKSTPPQTTPRSSPSAGQPATAIAGVDEQDLHLFQSVDIDGSGTISREEFLNAFVRAGLRLTDLRCSESLQELGLLSPRNDSEIDFESFQKIPTVGSNGLKNALHHRKSSVSARIRQIPRQRLGDINTKFSISWMIECCFVPPTENVVWGRNVFG